MSTVKVTLNQAVIPASSSAIAAGVRAGTDAVARIAARDTPVLSGELRNSQATDAQGPNGVITYTDSKAVAAHENLADRHPRGGHAKFLENALMEGRSDFLAAVAQHVRSAIN